MSDSVFASQANFLRQKNKELREDVESRIALSEHFMFDGFQAGAEAAKKELIAMLKICDRREAELCKVASD
ncbi:hypothetical protein PROAA_610028 [Candidatus Propionivibrio aalborgensis]|uniref:Uncharacterized protein n=1 Tax=Candidatus Propionivibrio aalborgensis TaxID=1860101 RepID=A0A1A8Y2P9_9RHOO|nr:hypothetical protein [Candidatus Propionivibrio aalborgensis]SBT10668.1 hypothetical protein PROAA_610028 [Candidatus Propionivibrio aalborgensis]